MATKEQIDTLIKELKKVKPTNFVTKIDETSAGIGAVLRYLYESKETVTAGKISSFMNVSTARVAVLLKKMEAKGLIVKETGVEDARTTVVKLSDSGRQTVEKMQADLCREIGNVIDQVGMERMLEFIAITKEIHEVVKGPSVKV